MIVSLSSKVWKSKGSQLSIHEARDKVPHSETGMDPILYAETENPKGQKWVTIQDRQKVNSNYQSYLEKGKNQAE